VKLIIPKCTTETLRVKTSVSQHMNQRFPPYQRNNRLQEVGRDLWRSSGPIPRLKQGHLDQAAQDHIQMAFEYLQG